MKKLFACLILVVLIFQAVFISVAAEGEDVVMQDVPFSETSILQDFGVSDEAELKALFGGSYGPDESWYWEVVNASYEGSGAGIRFYLWLMRRCTTGFVYIGNSFSLNLVSADPNSNATSDVSARVISTAGQYFCKVVFELPPSSSLITHFDGGFNVTLRTIRQPGATVSFRAYSKVVPGGVSESDLGLNFSVGRRGLNDPFVQTFTVEESLELDVTMMSERYSTSEGLDQWKQLNTCAFIIPNSYFERFGDLAVIHYVYERFEDVPMLVIEKNSAVNAAYSHAVQTQQHYNLMPFTVELYAPQFILLNVDFCRYFIFPVDEIHLQDGDPYDFTSSQAFAAYLDAKRIFLSSQAGVFHSFLKSSGSYYVNDYLTPDDTWSTLSFADYLDTQNWLTKLLFRISHWGDFEDDSLDNVSAIELIDSSLSDLSDAVIADNYYVDPLYASDLRALSESAVSSDGTLVLFRFCMTDYSVTNVNRMSYDGSYYDISGYVCENTIIDNFEIIEIDFKKTEMTPDGPVVVITQVPVEMDPETFIEGGQSEDSLVEGIVDHWPMPFSNSNGSSWWKRLIAIACAVVTIILVIWILRTLRSIFGSRSKTKIVLKTEGELTEARKKRRKKRDRE